MQAVVEVLQAQGAVVCALQGLRLTMAARHPATGVFDIANNDDQRPIGVILFRECVGRPFCRLIFRFGREGRGGEARRAVILTRSAEPSRRLLPECAVCAAFLPEEKRKAPIRADAGSKGVFCRLAAGDQRNAVKRLRAAFSGSGAEHSSETTARLCAPAATTSAALRA